MTNVEILLATVKADAKSLIKDMNIQSPVVIASQGNEWRVETDTVDNVSYRVFRTATRGVGINRNIALTMAREEFLLFADDDVVYSDGYEEEIIQAFDKKPSCDVLILRMKFTKNNQVYDEDCFQTKRIHMLNGLSYGTYQIAVRRKAIERTNIHFTHLFGGGCRFSCGEDSLFLIDCFRKGLKVYTYNYLLGTNRKDSSSWYTGMNEKYYFDKGVFLSLAFPKAKYLLLVYYAIRLHDDKEKDFGFIKKICLMRQGIKNYKSMKTYKEFTNQND